MPIRSIVAIMGLLLGGCQEPKPWCCSITHLKDGKCSPGYRRIEKFFHEQDGSFQTGCVLPAAMTPSTKPKLRGESGHFTMDFGVDFSVDELKPGEEIEMHLMVLPLESESPSRKL